MSPRSRRGPLSHGEKPKPGAGPSSTLCCPLEPSTSPALPVRTPAAPRTAGLQSQPSGDVGRARGSDSAGAGLRGSEQVMPRGGPSPTLHSRGSVLAGRSAALPEETVLLPELGDLCRSGHPPEVRGGIPADGEAPLCRQEVLLAPHSEGCRTGGLVGEGGFFRSCLLLP